MAERPESVSVGGFWANTAAVVSTTFSAPRSDSVVKILDNSDVFVAPGVRPLPKIPGITQRSKDIAVPAVFKMVFVAVFVITLGGGIAQIMMASAWTVTTANEQSVFEGMGFAWKSGIGAIFGLLGGKVLE
jgi:hypothetical protein